ncbi:nuclear receptor coactivator 7 isoform X17 [Condylostylus longicornis]|uniref:nuclear receptor coactivator 7 isoform X17 n=1 Tax=Condylostylus longicornis TaxID=2530218 RepID=UPI00244E2544|nr:nuclear receptor coactivator 7 isoform X17 [Condylostylus longicornis]
MINVLENGKYKPKKEWNSSIPSLVDIQEHHSDEENVSPSPSPLPISKQENSKTYGLPPKPPRRSSLAIGLLAGRGFTDKGNKRRSSITVAFLGRRDKIAKETSSFYESIVKTEKSDGSSNDPNIIFTSQLHGGSNNSLDDSNDNGNVVITPTPTTKGVVRFFEDNKNNQNQNINKKKQNNKITFNENDNINYDNKDSAIKSKNRGRRMSWQAKLERRRRKSYSKSFSTGDGDSIDTQSLEDRRKNSNGDVSSSTIDENEEIINFRRQKRNSWWNIFVPDNIKSRSKSRSVDHGLAAPFDLDSLRSKVEGRFESVDRLSKDGDKLKKSSLPSIPTTNYTVGNRDTLTSVAARFDTTPSELMHLNKLASNFIYSGQQLLVPDKSAVADNTSTTGSTSDDKVSTASGKSSPIERNISTDATNEEKDILDGLRPGSPKPGHIERVSTEGKEGGDDPVITQRFLKINVRHITDGQGVVGGVLLVTPNAVMFDPNVSDALVIEHGPESYGVIAPMELVVNAAIFHDIAHMRVAGTAGIGSGGGSELSTNQNEKIEVYYPKPKDSPRLEGTQSPGKDSLLVKDDTFPELGGVGVSSVETCDDQESIASSSGRDGNAFPKAFEKDRVTPVSENSSEKQDKQPENDCEKADTKDTTKTESICETQAEKKEASDNEIKKDELVDSRSTLEERRKSLLDHHWAIPSKDRISLNNSRRSSEDEGDLFNRRISCISNCNNISTTTRNSIPDSITEKNDAELAAAVTESLLRLNQERRNSSGFPLLDSLSGFTSQCRSNSVSGTTGLIGLSDGKYCNNSNIIAPTSLLTTAALNNINNVNSNINNKNINNLNNNIINSTINNISAGLDFENDNDSSLQSYYDSGIDIRDPIPVVAPMPTKKVFSDADIVLSSDWVPPRTISPTPLGESSPKPSTTNLLSQQTQSLDTTQTSPGGSGGRKKTSSVSFSVDENNEKEKLSDISDKTGDQNKKNKMLKRLSYPLTWVEGLTGDGQTKPNESVESAPNTGDSNQSVFSKVFSRRSSIGTFMRPSSTDGSTSSSVKQKSQPPQPKLDYRSMVSIDDMPELFVSFDKLIPRPARACQDPPLYLRLRMGKPIGKAIPLPTSVMSYGKNKLRPEYWFSVPKNRVDELYRFINTWVPHLYGELNEEEIKVRGFELIQHDTEWTKNSASKEGRKNSDGEDITELTRESWEVLSMSTDDYRKASLFASNSFDLDFPIPDLIGTTEILTEEHREKLCSHLPARAEGYSWSLVFSTSQHGFSLNSLYRKMQRLESPVLIVIEDTEHNVFGALTSCSLHVSDHFYGTGESLLYKFNPSFKVFHWTGENLYFIKGNPESLSIGAGDGKFGLWLDGDLNQGRSQTCSTYGNETLAPQEDFVIKTLECWAFV